ncbi:MAG TPA: APC family permease [Kofleriaceae bacterium]|nr:APC family permease [Kofleriaceae bacterium]
MARRLGDFARGLFGRAKNLRDPQVFHHMSLVAFLAWVGLGADGLSSSSYGPAEAFKALGHWNEGAPGACEKNATAELSKLCTFVPDHAYLAVFIAIAIAATVFIISWSYRRIIEEFPHGGGGYIVASKHLGPYVGAMSGCALLVDYVLTIAVSLSAGVDAVLSLDFVPDSLQAHKLVIVLVVLGLLTLMNLRGVKESVTILTPIFLAFLLTHAVLIFGAIITNIGNAGEVTHRVVDEAGSHVRSVGILGVSLVFMRAFSLGGGTFTGIEAVSNGIAIMREPRVRTAKRTMTLMATSLAITASGILLAYLLVPGVLPTPNDKVTMNAVLAQRFAGTGPIALVFTAITLVSEGALLFVAAQAGFVDGPRVMANMALDQWMPHRMAAVSEQLTMRNGVYLMAAAAAIVLVYTNDSVDALVVMYSINVFITFTLSNVAMIRHAVHTKQGRWQRAVFVHGLAAAVCAMILVITVIEKFTEGGWLTTVITASLVVLCYLIRRHYRAVGAKVVELSKQLALAAPPPGAVPPAPEELDPTKQTAVVLAGGFGGLGIHTLLQIPRVFPGQFHQVVFIAAGVIDAGVFKGKDEIDAMSKKIEADLDKYVEFARQQLGWAADKDFAVGTEAVTELDHLCREVALRFPRSIFFAGKLIFQEESWYQRILHNETAAAVERRLQFAGLPMIVMPIRMFH